MLKKIMIILVLLAISVGAYFYLNSMQDTQTENEAVIDEVAFTETEANAVDILNGEIMMDECTAYAVEDKVPDTELKQYLEACVEQLRLQDSMIPPPPGEAVIPPPAELVIEETNSEVNPPKIVEPEPAIGPTIDAAIKNPKTLEPTMVDTKAEPKIVEKDSQ